MRETRTRKRDDESKMHERSWDCGKCVTRGRREGVNDGLVRKNIFLCGEAQKDELLLKKMKKGYSLFLSHSRKFHELMQQDM
jgi:hypothetical protein